MSGTRVSNQRWFLEVFEVLHDWSTSGTKLRESGKRTQHVMKGSTDVCWRDIPYLQESLQVMTEDAAHQEQKKKSVEDELMTKVEKMPCGTQCLHNTFRQERMRDTKEEA